MPDAPVLHRESVVVDAHNDLLMTVAARPPAQWSAFFRANWLPQLREGGVDVQVLPVFIDTAFQPEQALRQTLRMIESAHTIAAGSPGDVALCRDADEIDRAVAEGRIALVLALEGCPAVDTDVELLSTLYRLGVRITSFTHFGRSALADGSGEDATGGRLTRAGVDAVGLMEELGMLLDVSHLGAEGVAHVLEIANRPVLASHSCARALRDHHRNLTDEQLRGIANTGGVICVNFLAAFVHDSDPSMERLVDHFEHMVGVAGPEHVGIGPDFVWQVFSELTPRWCDDLSVEGLDPLAHVAGLRGPSGLPLVTAALLRRGFDEATVTGVLGGNLMRLFRQELTA